MLHRLLMVMLVFAGYFPWTFLDLCHAPEAFGSHVVTVFFARIQGSALGQGCHFPTPPSVDGSVYGSDPTSTGPFAGKGIVHLVGPNWSLVEALSPPGSCASFGLWAKLCLYHGSCSSHGGVGGRSLSSASSSNHASPSESCRCEVWIGQHPRRLGHDSGVSRLASLVQARHRPNSSEPTNTTGEDGVYHVGAYTQCLELPPWGLDEHQLCQFVERHLGYGVRVLEVQVDYTSGTVRVELEPVLVSAFQFPFHPLTPWGTVLEVLGIDLAQLIPFVDG